MTKGTGTAAGGTVKCAAFWCHDGRALAAFYAAPLGWEATENRLTGLGTWSSASSGLRGHHVPAGRRVVDVARVRFPSSAPW